ncbi:Putative PAS domain, signal transduction response regulator, receiver domain, CheY-like superfamily [Septoria linicola]|uniref:PAS domain, signal transduction response regulator, receiver domain, CheY-like superfamily n=1 Tax=Septoria linicola TaxID=215465 RepID=A0A9Q9AFT2_9PEZI|nr:Putative PAS domain, signal transduction response regulator, receiver domain, CheY-like superfamily [Septoria linicola]
MVNLTRNRSNSIRRFDWTQNQISSDFQRSTRDDVDWKSSPLGSMASWPPSLRQMVLLAMADTTASAVIWGSLVASPAIVYNEALALLISNRHPVLQGQAVRSQLTDHCAELDSLYDAVLATGSTQTVRNQRVRQDRLGFVEERAYTWKLVPILADDGSVSGALVTVEDEDKLPPRRERSKSAVREIGNTLKGVIDRTAYQTATNAVRLHAHLSGSSCDCEKLWEITKQLEMHEARYERFADYAPVGIAALDREYQVEWANKAYFDVMAQPLSSKSFMSYVHPEDAAMVQGYFEAGAFRDDSWTFECRLKKSASYRAAVSPSETPRPLDTSPAWVLVSAYRGNDQEQHTMAWIIDITAHKHAEDILRKRVKEAVVAKAQKERFIDQICHEIRNPLSAMMHCADEIIENAKNKPQDWTHDVLEAAQNIAYCSQHIQNIVGDVLTLSKLDSNLIEISLEPTQPVELFQQALKVFNGELRAEGIELRFESGQSIPDLDIDWLLLDQRRAQQVLMNLVTNAIKVIKGRAERKITVKLNASTKMPCQDTAIQCVLPRQQLQPIDFGEQYADKESVYINVAVEDTGPGLEATEMASLFERFAEENPKTESKYGGSGLGLFIARDLTELQGGRIALGSQAGVGSTFAFSIESKRTSPPAVKIPLQQIEIPTTLRTTNTLQSPSPAEPVTVLQEAKSCITEQSQSLKGQGVPRKPEQEPPKLRILIVEDNFINQKVLANQLRKRGYHITCANHGEEALEILNMTSLPATPEASMAAPPSRPALLPPTPASSQSNLSSSPCSPATLPVIKRKPVPSATTTLLLTPAMPTLEARIHPPPFDLILMDIEMPICDGITCTKRIRAFEAAAVATYRRSDPTGQAQSTRKLPIIAVTANARSEHGIAALESGMDAVTTKPYKVDELVEKMEMYAAAVSTAAAAVGNAVAGGGDAEVEAIGLASPPAVAVDDG